MHTRELLYFIMTYLVSRKSPKITLHVYAPTIRPRKAQLVAWSRISWLSVPTCNISATFYINKQMSLACRKQYMVTLMQLEVCRLVCYVISTTVQKSCGIIVFISTVGLWYLFFIKKLCWKAHLIMQSLNPWKVKPQFPDNFLGYKPSCKCFKLIYKCAAGWKRFRIT